MVSQLKVNEIVTQSGSTITIGNSGDTVSLGSGASQSLASNTPVNGSRISSGLIELQGSANYIQTTCTAHTMIDLSESDTVEAYVYLKDENGGTANVAPNDSQFGGYQLIGV